MIPSYLSILSLLILLLVLPAPTTQASAFNIDKSLTEITANDLINNVNRFDWQIKRGQVYDESKDPALRKGTENWEQDQGSYFTVPALVLGIVGLLLFFSRNKN